MTVTHKIFIHVPIFISVVSILTSCAHKSDVIQGNSAKNMSLPMELKLKGETGRIELLDNCSQSVTKTFMLGDLRHKRIENVSFKVKTITKETLANSDIKQEVQTVFKEGGVNLHEMAYPEFGESIEMILTPNCQVTKAGRYPKNSLFFLPPLPLKKGEVKIGDSWQMENSWQSENGHLTLTAKIQTEFKSLKTCGVNQCAELIVTGEVHMPEIVEKKNDFSHKLNGRFLFDPNRGLLVWSEFGSVEHLNSRGALVEVRSVLRSHLLEPQGYHIASREEPSCPLESTEE